ncbi:MAG: T9SS type A sorting domain-containing protein [Bacteroidetes bacterium]|nr:T9SS type A sorting domain-containing protein [Bacteroidota bacterium]
MKKLNLFSWMLACLCTQHIHAQCIKDIQNLITNPTPCFFVGNIDFENPDCFDVFAFPQWKYTWKIRAADDGELMATYSGPAFQHTFKKFGGYDFCLEIDKDGDPTNAPDYVDCKTYTTCQICTEAEIEFEYISCPYNAGCNVQLTAEVDAENAVGLVPSATFIVTYYPNTIELLGGYGEYDLVFPRIDVEYHPETGIIYVAEDVTVPFKRGCFKPRLVFTLEEGAGAHGWDGLPCPRVDLFGNNVFRCIACANEEGKCEASLLATHISNENGTCEIFNCALLRSSEEGDDEEFARSKGYSVSPNPARDELHVDLPEATGTNRQISLYNYFGQLVQSAACPEDSRHLDLNLSALNSGIFMLVVHANGRVVHSTQVVVSK